MDIRDAQEGRVLTRSLWFAFAALLVVVVAACGAGDATLSELDEVNSEKHTSPKPQDTLPGDLVGADRRKVDEGPVEFEAGEDGFELSVSPLPDTATTGLVPQVDPGSRTRVILLHHGGAVSVLSIEDDGALEDIDMEWLVATAMKALASVSPEPTASIPEPRRHTGVPGAAMTAVLTFDSEVCRNDGTVEAFGVVWELADPVPFAWQGMIPKEGLLTIVDDWDAAFAMADDTELRVTIGAIEDYCFSWDDDEG